MSISTIRRHGSLAPSILSSSTAVKSWQQANSRCLDRLEDVDKRHIQKAASRQLFVPAFETWRQSLTDSQRNTGFSLELLPTQVSDFEAFVRKVFQDQVDLDPFWGMTVVALRRAKDAVACPPPASHRHGIENVLSRMGEMLETIAEKMQQLALTEVTDVFGLTEVYKILLQFLERAILSLRKGISFDLSDQSWSEVEVEFKSSIDKFGTFLTSFNQRQREFQTPSVVPETQILHRDTFASLTLSAEPATVDIVHTVILPAKNIRFYGRDKIMEQIDGVLKPTESLPGIRSTILYGLGGVGKTEIAREYAYRAEPKCDSIFWIPSESSMSIQEAFTNAALRLNLEGAKENEHQKNGHIMMKWLESTVQKWLLIFNNVDDANVLNGRWPNIGSGSVLVTTRNAKPFFTRSKSKIEVKAFSDSEGPQYLISLTGREDVRSKEELAAAKLLNELLGGHALGISQIAALIRSRTISIQEAVELYQDYSRGLHDVEAQPAIDGDSTVDLTTLWALQFNGLEPDSRSLMGVMAYISPDGVNDTIFNLKKKILSPKTKENLRFCIDLPSFWKAETQLLDVSLIQKTAGTGQLSIHRLMQVEFQYFINPQERQLAFENATTLLSLVFPKQIKGQPMFGVWSQCQLYYAHIISLAHRYMQQDEELGRLKPNLEFCEVLSNCAWYLRERSALELDSLLEAGLYACRKIMSEPGVELVYAHLCNTASAWDDDRGFFQRAEPRFLECLAIRRKYLDPYDDELSGALHNISLNYLMSMKFEECLDYRAQSIHIIERMPAGRVRDLKLVKRDFVLGRCQFFQGKYSEARETQLKVLAELKRLGEWFMTALTYNALGNISYAEGKFKESEAEFQSANRVVVDAGREDDYRTMTGTRFFLAKAAMAQGQIPRTVKLLRQLLQMDQGLQTPVEKSRVLWMLSKALKLLPPDAQLLDEFKDDPDFPTLNSDELEQEAKSLLQERCPDLDLSQGIHEQMFVGLIHEARL